MSLGGTLPHPGQTLKPPQTKKTIAASLFLPELGNRLARDLKRACGERLRLCARARWYHLSKPYKA